MTVFVCCYSHFVEIFSEIFEFLWLKVIRPHQILELFCSQGEAAAQNTGHCSCTKLTPRVETLQPGDDLSIHLILLSQITGHPRMLKNLHEIFHNVSLVAFLAMTCIMSELV